MPIAVDVSERLQTIAVATLEVAEARGTDGITLRSVAERLGGSTTLVTNYLRNRSELITNAVQYALRRWHADLDARLDDCSASEHLMVVALWSCSTEGDDALIRRLLIEMLARPTPDSPLANAVRHDAREHHDELRRAAFDAAAPDPAFTADVLHLALRGFYLASLEDPQRWTSERVTPVLRQLVDRLSS